MFDDGLETETSKQQKELEARVLDLYAKLADAAGDAVAQDNLLSLLRTSHIKYLHNGLGELPSGFAVLDASRPWICYWILHSLAILDAPLPSSITPEDIVAFIKSCRAPDGGYGGGPGQLAHLAPTYAAVAALVTLGTDEALQSIDRAAMRSYLLKMAIGKDKGGGFYIHEGGEADVRATYCALAVARMLCLDMPELLEASAAVDYVARCQTYEGGMGGEPGNEAHGGYTFCGLAALVMAQRADAVDLPRLLHWACSRQGWAEGGFNGRTNKLVDGCYSFWQGGLFALLQQLELRQLQVMEAAEIDPAGPIAAARADNPLLRVNIKPPITPSQQAQRQVEQRELSQQAITMQALAASEQVHAALASSTQRTQLAASAEARGLLNAAHKARESLEAAQENGVLVAHGALALCGGRNDALPAVWFECDQWDYDSMDDATAQLLQVSGEDVQLPQSSSCLMDAAALQLWLLECCQVGKGGLRDKPGKGVDHYHTCYCLSGLAAAQGAGELVLGGADNEVAKTDAACNVVRMKLNRARVFFASRSL